MKILLASNSPRRKEILTKGNIDFTVVKSDYKEESFIKYEESFIKKNSLYKALDAAKSVNFPAVVIGADTMVILREDIGDVCLLKPQNYNEAFLMLKKLSGCTHKVVTSISLVQTPPVLSSCKNLNNSRLNSENFKHLTEIEETFVTFRKLHDDEINRYLEIFKPFDKAGSYGIQDFLILDKEYKNSDGENTHLKLSENYKAQMPNTDNFIEKIEGDYFNVMGISLKKLKTMLKEFQ